MEGMDSGSIMNLYVVPWAIKIALALLIFVIGRKVVDMIVGVAQKLMRRQEMDEILVRFISSIIKWLLLLPQVDLPETSNFGSPLPSLLPTQQKKQASFVF